MRDFALPTSSVYLYSTVRHITNGIAATNSADQQLHCLRLRLSRSRRTADQKLSRKRQKSSFLSVRTFDRDTYAAEAKARFAAMGYSIETAHAVPNPRNAIEQTDAIFIGGGNTFRLLKALQDLDLLDPIRQKVRGGAPYIGSSAGSNVAGSDDQNHQGHANCSAALVRLAGSGAVSNQPAFSGPGSQFQAYGRDAGGKNSSVSRGERNTGSRNSRRRMAGLRKRRRYTER